MKGIITKIFQIDEIKNGKRVFPSIIVSKIKNWDGKKTVTNCFMNFAIIGTQIQGSKAYDRIVSYYPGLYKTAEIYASTKTDTVTKIINDNK